MAFLLSLVLSLLITPSISQIVNCYGGGSMTGNTCQGTNSSILQPVSGNTIYCLDRYSCRYATLSATSNLLLYGYSASYYTTITAVNVYAHGYQSAEYATITATGLVQLSGEQSGYYAKAITAPLVQIWGYQAAFGADDIIADTVDITGYQGAYSAAITASKVDVTGDEGGIDADIYPKDGSLNITFNAVKAGYNTDILCEDNVDCSIQCVTADSCYGVMFYCVGSGQCNYSQQCGDDSTGESADCLKFYKEGVDGLEATDIYQLYEMNKARRYAPADDQPLD